MVDFVDGTFYSCVFANIYKQAEILQVLCSTTRQVLSSSSSKDLEEEKKAVHGKFNVFPSPRDDQNEAIILFYQSM